MIIKNEHPQEQPPAFGLPKIELVIPDAHKQQLQQAIITLVTVLLSIVLTLSAQMVSQTIRAPEPLPTDPLITLGTTHFSDVSVTSNLAVGGAAAVTGNATVGGTLGVTGATTLGAATVTTLTVGSTTYAVSDPITITGVLTDVVLLYLQN